MAILAILFLVMMSILDQSSRAWNDAEQRIDAFREGRAAQFVMNRDLEGLVQPTGKPFFFRNQNVSPEIIRINAGLPPPANGDTLFFTTLLPLNAQTDVSRSNLCLVGYYLAYISESTQPGAKRSYNLYRHLSNSNDTFTALENFYTTNNPPMIATFPRPPAGFNGDEVLARNVINFKVTLFKKNPATGAVEKFTGPDWVNTDRPAMVTIEFDALNYSTASLLESAADWYGSGTFEQIRNRARQKFTSTIKTGL